MNAADDCSLTHQEALDFHRLPQPGKLGTAATKPMATQRDLSLAYSPGVAAPVLAIAANPEAAYDYTAKGNLVAVVTNGTAILGLGALGALASKPVMEGKAVLFKRFADIDAIDVEVSAVDPDEVISVVKNIAATYGGINLEDIRSPECFRIESELQDLLDIPVFHDDQHGTAIICAAGLINACLITGRDLESIKVVLNGPGAAGIATLELIKAMGVPHANVIAVDRRGVLFRGRADDMDQWKTAHAVETEARTLAEALKGADVFIGLSAKGALSGALVESMAPQPIIFAMANPDPEITPEEVYAVRPDAIVATGRSDYPNQLNNVLGFPYIFRGALDVRARRVNLEMKIACATALARLAREPVPVEVSAAYGGASLVFGPNHIVPTPFDPRLLAYVPPLVAQAAMDTGVARRPIPDMDLYRAELASRSGAHAGRASPEARSDATGARPLALAAPGMGAREEELSFADVAAAARRLDGVAHRTAVLTSRQADAEAGATLLFKMESYQRGGSFKFRGAYNAIAQLSRAERSAGVVAFSSGNHGQAVALAGRLLGCPATIVMPTDAPAAKLEAVRGYGARVILYDRQRDDREALAADLVAGEGLTAIHPFDHRGVIAGQGTVALELFSQAGGLDELYVPLGGGGLTSGAALVAAELYPNCRIFGVEPEAGDDVQRSFRSGVVTEIPPPATIADGARTQKVGALTFPILRRHLHDVLTVSDDELRAQMQRFMSRMKAVVEPTGCLGAAAAMRHARRGARVGVIVSGGNVDVAVAPGGAEVGTASLSICG